MRCQLDELRLAETERTECVLSRLKRGEKIKSDSARAAALSDNDEVSVLLLNTAGKTSQRYSYRFLSNGVHAPEAEPAAGTCMWIHE